MAALGATRPARAQSGGVDLIFRGGTIIPMSGADRYTEAVAVDEGRIVAVGTEAEVMSLRTTSTRVVDLAGRTLLPGLIDPHQHTGVGAVITALFEDVGYPTYKTRQAVFDAVRVKAAKTPANDWLYFFGFDNLLQGGELSIGELDTLSTTHPIMIYYNNMHTAAVNSAALKAAKIPDDIQELPGGGRFRRDANGKLNGLVDEESALRRMLVGLPKLTPQFVGKATADWLKRNSVAGITAVHEAGVTVAGDLLQGYERIAVQSPCRISISLVFPSMNAGDPYKEFGRGARATQVPNCLLSFYAIKIVADGSNQTKTAAQTVPYLGGEGKGELNYEPAQLKKMVAEVKEAGWPVSIHANGDATIDAALDAIEATYGPNPVTGVNRIEHCTMARADQIARMKALGVQPSFLMNHVHLYGAAYRDLLFGAERAERMDAAGDCVRADLPFTLHTDSPVTKIGVLQLVQTAVTRRCLFDNSVIGKNQAVSLTDALKAVTVHAAGQIGMRDRLGSLERGKEADLTILESDPYKVDPDKIADIKVSETWVAGKKAFG
ncbi:amidohydrolase [Reyranella sp.]|uniref:amidohydrolase n=1 Tax=Reyranella sp. TaxID=1929291 RepID=UPI0025CCDD62|nr:amidohydrolase [Reyranella sp.]